MADPRPTAEKLELPTIDTLRGELALRPPSEITVAAEQVPDLDAKADEIVDRLIKLEPSNPEERESARAAIESMAVDVQQRAAHRSAMLKEPMRDLSTRAEDGAILRDAAAVKRGEDIRVKLARGTLAARATGREE